ncbi:hypothetical protein P3T51_08930 [Weissella confusa]|uniref:hypothetical protein n=1 Tax=Weissella confusa TaxID=1583 RepID=UPI0024082382|nr:hypothetical protein [Weissella confusa]WEY47679.1 hypothetical protein P3T51_08930 [Weissella confusa]
MDFDLHKALDKAGDGLKDVGDNLKEAGDVAHKTTADFHKKFVSDKLPKMGKYGDLAQGAAEMVPGVGTYNAAVKGDWVGAATAAGIDVGAAAVGVATAETGYAAVKGGAVAAKAGLKIGAKEIAKTAVEKSVKEGVEKVTKEATEKVVKEGTEKVAKETAEKATKEVASSTTEKAAVSTVAKSADEVGDVAKRGVDDVSKKLDDTSGIKPSVGTEMKTEKFGDYLTDVEKQTGIQLGSEQRTLLQQEIKNNNFQKLSPEATMARRNDFELKKTGIISEWEKHTGQEWPKYTEDVVNADGLVIRKAGQNYDAHHLIENTYGGPNEWYNVTPAAFPDGHQGGIHRTGGVIKEVFGG